MTDAREKILIWCREGDRDAFQSFYREQAGRLWKFLVARGCDRDTAYDLLAEAFLRFIQSVCRDPRAPVALLYRIALNLRIDQYRRAQVAPYEAVAEPDELGAASTVEPDDHEYVRELVKALPESEQNMLLLRYWIGLSHKEVAQALSMPEGTVRRQCSEALDRLRARWKRDENQHGTG